MPSTPQHVHRERPRNRGIVGRGSHGPTKNRGDTGKLRLAQAAEKFLADKPEAELRAQQIAEDAGVTVALITHHFGSRNQLVASAQKARLEKKLAGDLKQLKRVFAAVNTPETFRDAVTRVVERQVKIDPSHQRAVLALFGAAHGRHDVAQNATDAYNNLVAAWTNILLDAQQNGIVSNNLDVRAVASTVTSMLYGVAFTGFDAHLPNRDRVAAIITAMLSGLLGVVSPRDLSV